MKLVKTKNGWVKVIAESGWTLFQTKNIREAERWLTEHIHDNFPSLSVIKPYEVSQRIAYGLP